MGMGRNTERRELESRSEQITFLKPFARGAWFGACWGSACLEGCPGAKQRWRRWLLTKPGRWRERRWFGETDIGTSLQGGGGGDVIYMNSTGVCGVPGLTLLMKAAPGETWASPRVLNVLSAWWQCPALHTPHCTCPCLGLFPVLGVAQSLPPAAQVYLTEHCRDLKKRGSSAPADCHHDLKPWVSLERWHKKEKRKDCKCRHPAARTALGLVPYRQGKFPEVVLRIGAGQKIKRSFENRENRGQQSRYGFTGCTWWRLHPQVNIHSHPAMALLSDINISISQNRENC